MNKQQILSFTTSLLIFFVLLFLYSKFGPSLPISVLTQTKGEPMVVSGTGKVTVVPDIAKVTVGIEANGANLKQVQSEVNLKSDNLTAELKKSGIREADIKTTNYNIFPEYDFETRAQRIIGYRVSTSYEIKITDFEKVNEVLTMATQSGANTIGGISLEVNEETKKQKLQEAREMAVKEAKEKAEGLAKASHITLGKIINVTESSGGVDYPRPFLAVDKAVSNAGTEPAMPEADISPGESELNVSVSLSYEVR